MHHIVLGEITPFTSYDCFTIFSKNKEEFDFSLHTHEDMALTLILNAKSAKRIEGPPMEEINDMELVFVRSNLSYGWFIPHAKVKTYKNLPFNFIKTCLMTCF
jgi:hypothetical protein